MTGLSDTSELHIEKRNTMRKELNTLKDEEYNILQEKLPLENELKKLCSGDISEMEIVAAKEHIVGEEIISSEDVEARMKRLARLYFSKFPLNVYTESIENIRALTKEELSAELLELLDFSKETAGVYGGSYGFKSFFKS